MECRLEEDMLICIVSEVSNMLRVNKKHEKRRNTFFGISTINDKIGSILDSKVSC